MYKIVVILPSPIQKTETFIRALVQNLVSNSRFQFRFIYPSLIFNRDKFISLIIAPLYLNRIYSFWKSKEGSDPLKKLIQTYINIEIITVKNVKVIHYLFSNLAVGKENLAKIIGAKMSIGLRGYDITFYALNHPGSYSLEYWQNIDSIQYNSEDLYHWALHWGANNSIPKRQITAAVDDEKILESVNVQKFDSRKILQLVFVGRLHWKKGIENLFEVLRLLKEENRSFAVHIIGDGPEKEKVLFLKERYALEKQVCIHGKLSQTDIIPLLDESHIILAPSIQEGCSNVVLEAQARGLYCVVSDAEGMRTVVESEKTGSIHAYWDRIGMLNAILDYDNLGMDRKVEMANYTLSRVKGKFSRSQQLQHWNEYLENLCSTS